MFVLKQFIKNIPREAKSRIRRDAEKNEGSDGKKRQEVSIGAICLIPYFIWLLNLYAFYAPMEHFAGQTEDLRVVMKKKLLQLFSLRF